MPDDEPKNDEPKNPSDASLDDENDIDVPDPRADLELAPDPRDAPAPPVVAELAAACVRFVASKYKVPLDFEPETLSLIDQYVRDARAELTEKPDGESAQSADRSTTGAIDLIQASIGAYLGEVMRRAFGATWFCDGDHDGWRLDFSFVYLTFNPIGMAREALSLEAQDGWHGFLETDPGEREFLEGRLELVGDVDEEEFYAPTTRFDVVEIAVDTLRAKMEADGNGDVTFGAHDYTR
jgi:hypothetical protein